MKLFGQRPLGSRVIRAVALLSALGAGLCTAASGSEQWATLEAIHQIENPKNLSSPGPCGELGPYQFRELTWKMHTQAPFQRALDRKTSDAVAVKHYQWIKAEIERRGLPATPYRIALAWNGGIEAALGGHPPGPVADYAARAANLTAAFEHSNLASTP